MISPTAEEGKRGGLSADAKPMLSAVGPERPHGVSTFVVCAGVGGIVEGAASLLHAYTYDPPWLIWMVILGVFGGGMGFLIHITSDRPVWFVLLASATCGTVAEATNAGWVHAWAFSPKMLELVPNNYIRAIVSGISLGALTVVTRRLVSWSPWHVAAAPAYDKTEWLSSVELRVATPFTVLRLVFLAVRTLARDRVSLLIGSTVVVLMLWGPHGNLELLRLWSDRWMGPSSQPELRTHPYISIPWDQEWISFFGGFTLLVGVPAFLIWFILGERLSDYGLGLPSSHARRLTFWGAITLLAIGLPSFILASQSVSVRAAYPVYRGKFIDLSSFAAYELGYFMFFLAIEFLFRGYLLFGLRRFLKPLLGGSERLAGTYAIILSMLAYTTWHLGKPLPELWGTLIWGIAAATIALVTESVWMIVVVHWLLNVIMDYLIVRSNGAL